MNAAQTLTDPAVLRTVDRKNLNPDDQAHRAELVRRVRLWSSPKYREAYAMDWEGEVSDLLHVLAGTVESEECDG